MEKLLKKMGVIFFICIIGVISIVLIINYNNNKENQKLKKKVKNDLIQENTKSKEKSQEESEELKAIENNQLEQNNNNTSSNNSSNIEPLNQEENNYIPVSKFRVKIQNNRLYIGDTTKLTTIIYPSDATNQEVSYQSSNKNIAIVSKNGVVTGVNVGECYITITVKNAGSGQIKVRVISKNNTTYSNSQSTIEENTEYTQTQQTIPNETLTEEVNYNQTNDSSMTPSNDSSVIPNNDTTISSNINDSTTSTSNIENNNSIQNNNQPVINQTPSSNDNTNLVKNGWYKENNNKYYYKDNKLVKDAYIDYIYLDNNGVAKEKIGSFSATLYGAIAWANQSINIREKANQNSSKIGTVPSGGKMKILSSENSSTKYIKIKYNNKTGYVYSDYLYINLPDVIPDIIYNISNANKSIYKTFDKSIPNVTGSNLYGFSKSYNEKIGKSTYYAPLLYPVAKQLQKAYNKAVKQGYNLKIYDTYRPQTVSQKINQEFKKLYNSNKKVKNAIDYDKDGKYWGTGWFLANSISSHNRGVAIDLTLTDKNGKELKAQSSMHMLDTRSVRKYNNSTAKTLSSIMTSVGFETLDSEWWHFQEDNYKSSIANSFYIK